MDVAWNNRLEKSRLENCRPGGLLYSVLVRMRNGLTMFDSSIIMHRRPGIVLSTPNKIPACGQEKERYEYYGRVIHGCCLDG